MKEHCILYKCICNPIVEHFVTLVLTFCKLKHLHFLFYTDSVNTCTSFNQTIAKTKDMELLELRL